jgi:serine/threonine protein kinase/tetratricopeptide (TPR) repeat protein
MPTRGSLVGQSLGHYSIVEEIGAGGMGVVYRAHDQKLDRDVAVKVLPPGTLADQGSRSRFEREARALGRLSHPNVAIAFEFDTDGDIDFLVTELIPGVTLDHKLSAGPLPEREALDLAIEMASGLECAHQQGIVHRDLKPGNLRITPDGHLKILDFGLAQLVGPQAQVAATLSLDEVRSHAGTLPYMAPEQLRGEAADPRSDIWAAGAVFYEMVTGRRAFPALRGPMISEAILHGEPARPSTVNARVSPAIEAVILKCLDKNPATRYQTARELKLDLVRLSTGDSPGSVTTNYGTPSNRRYALALSLVALLLTAAAAFFVLHRRLSSGNRKERVLAVLPFDSVDKDQRMSALGIGLTETLTAKLSEVSNSNDVQLVPTRDVQAHAVKTAEDAWKEFGSDLALDCNLQQAGEMMRINCVLVDARTRRQIDARTITGPAHDIFDIEDQVVNSALELLALRIGSDTRKNLVAHRDTPATAYEHFIRGLGYLEEYQSAENIDSAIAEFQHAIDIDQRYAPAYAALGEAYWLGFQQANRPNEWVTRAIEYCDKSLSISSEFSGGHTCLGQVYNGTGRYADALKQYQTAVALDENSRDAIRGLAETYDKLNQKSAAEGTYRRAIQLHSRDTGSYFALGKFYYDSGRYRDAEQVFQKVIEIAPNNAFGYSNLAGTYLAMGRYAEAVETLNRSNAVMPTADAYSNIGYAYFQMKQYQGSAVAFQKAVDLDNREWLAWGNLGDALYWAPGRRKEASSAYEHAISLAKAKLEVNPRDPLPLAYTAGYYAMLDQKSAALENLKRALSIIPQTPDVLMRAAVVYVHFGDKAKCIAMLRKALAAGLSPETIRDTPDFDSLRGEREFQALLATKG